MLAGVTIEKPETVTIDPDVDIGEDTVVEPFAQILGRTAVGRDCRIGAASIVRDSLLGNNVQIGPFTVIGASRVDDGAVVGPYARLRHDNHVAAGARVGNFVEMKNARLGPRSKAQHLAYLGDSQIGEDVNIGAGTVICNYDGRRKHQTTIGNGVFVGTNATLVAPLEIGDTSYIAAGSVITDPVPPDKLAHGRGPGRCSSRDGPAAARANSRTDPAGRYFLGRRTTIRLATLV
jgi:bifunctional UDP-N-acetylglucosamine pyrophosphorylase/glucosamine-1-phosphate N-acetyltransferase